MSTVVKEYKILDQNINELENEMFADNKPFIIRGLELNGLKDKWSQKYFDSIQELKDRTIPVHVSEKSKVEKPIKEHSINKNVYIGETKVMTIVKALEYGLTKGGRDGKYYNLLEAQIPELVDDISLPDFVKNKGVWGNLWIGNYNTTRLHFDVYNNFFFQVKGTKKFTLIEPEYYFSLYPISSNTSDIKDIENVDYNKYPLFKYVKKITVTLRDGDFLYLPSFWWHHVESNEPYISYNYWSVPDIESYMCEPGSYYIKKHFEIGDFYNMYQLHLSKQTSSSYTPIETAQKLLFNGYNWASTLLLLSYLEHHMKTINNNNNIDVDTILSSNIKPKIEAFKSQSEEINVKNINYETIGEERMKLLIDIAFKNKLILDEDLYNLNMWLGYIKPAKFKDNTALNFDRVNDMINGVRSLVNRN